MTILACSSASCGAPDYSNAKASYPLRQADDMLVRRVQAAYGAVQRSARFWPGFDKTEVKAILIYDSGGEWFFGQSEDLRGFYRTGQVVNGMGVTYAQPSLYLTGEVKPYARIRRQDGWLGRIGWRDFDADSYRKRTEPMMILQELETALENHPALTSTEDWIGVYVHECFHVFQHGFTDVQKASTIEWEEKADRGVVEDLAEKGALRAPIAEEFAILNGAADDPAITPASAKKRLRRWLDAREQRVRGFQRIFQYAGGKGNLDRLDMSLLSAEGTATYVENRYLTTPEAYRDASLESDPRSLQYAGEGARTRQTTRSITYKTAGNYFYSIGDLVSRLLDVADPSWKKKVFDRRRLLIGAVEAAVED